MRDLPESIDRAALVACAREMDGRAGWDLDGLRALGLEPNEIIEGGLTIEDDSRLRVTRVLLDNAGRLVPDGHNGAMTVTAEIPLMGLWPSAGRA